MCRLWLPCQVSHSLFSKFAVDLIMSLLMVISWFSQILQFSVTDLILSLFSLFLDTIDAEQAGHLYVKNVIIMSQVRSAKPADT